MARSYPSRRFPGGPFIEPSVTPAMRGPKRTGPIGELVPGDDVEVARILARLGRKPLKEPICYAIKLTGDLVTDEQLTVATDGFFIWPIEWDVDLLSLVFVSLACSTVSSSGDTVMQVRKIQDSGDPDVDLLETVVTLEEGLKHSKKSDESLWAVVDLEHSQVVEFDELALDFTSVGVDQRGLTVHFWFR